MRATNCASEPASQRASTAAMLFAEGSSSACSACSSVSCSPSATETTDSSCRRRRSVSATTDALSVIVGPSSPARSGWSRRIRYAVITFATLAIGAACWFGPACSCDCPERTNAAWPCAGHTVSGIASRDEDDASSW